MRFYTQKYKGFQKFIKGKNFRSVFQFYHFKQFLSQHRMNGCDC
jgi:hypothetical protein